MKSKTATQYARYPLAADGTIRQWLACGPVAPRLDGLDTLLPVSGDPHGHQRRWVMNYWAYHPEVILFKKRVYAAVAPFGWQPDELPVVDGPAMGDQTWRAATAGEDRMLDFSRFNFVPSLMQGWAYTIISVTMPQTVPVEIFTIGPVQLWNNGALLHQSDDSFSYVAPLTVKTELPLQAGENHLYLHGLMPGWREARLALGMRLHDAPDAEIRLPTGAISPERWHAAEAALEHVNLKQFAFPDLPATIELDAAALEPVELDVTVALPAAGSPWAQFETADAPSESARIALKPGESAALPTSRALAEAMARLPGENVLSLTLGPADGTPLRRIYPVWLSANRYSSEPYGDYETRRSEALHHLAQMADYDVLATVAAVETGRAKALSSRAIGIACEFLNSRSDCADFYALSLIAMMNRYGDRAALQSSDRARVEAAFLGFKFWIDEPGIDGMCYCTENHQILFHVTGYLSGQYWRDRTFANSGLTGRQQMARALPRIKSWILRRLSGGFSEWDSNAYLTMDIFSMLALVEFAESARLREMATTLLHKAFFMIASQSFRGAHGSTHGRCYVDGLKSARAENSSNIQRIAWGMGIFNGETRATGLLSMARRYRVPEVLQRIGADVARTDMTFARSHAPYRPEFDMHRGAWDVRTITSRTPDYMLSAAVDHRPAAMGVQEHLWQATLGPEAAVFTNYPGNVQLHGQARPNYWAGSFRLPRVGIAENTVICLYNVDPKVGLGFAHAYFPTAHFDEWRIDGQWAFARVGEGYVALWGDGDLRLMTRGQHAMQEIRSGGAGETWLCTVGRAATDGDFGAFCRAVQRHAPLVQGGALAWTTLSGNALAFGWDGPLTVDGQPVDWSAFPHYANAYTTTPLGAEVMEIAHSGETLRLDLKRGRVITQ